MYTKQNIAVKMTCDIGLSKGIISLLSQMNLYQLLVMDVKCYELENIHGNCKTTFINEQQRKL